MDWLGFLNYFPVTAIAAAHKSDFIAHLVHFASNSFRRNMDFLGDFFTGHFGGDSYCSNYCIFKDILRDILGDRSPNNHLEVAILLKNGLF